MQEIRTAHWVETHTVWRGDDGEEGHTFPMQHWLRMNPPAEAWHADYDSSWSHDVIDERGHLHTASTWKICHRYPNLRPISTEELLQRVLFMSPSKLPPAETDTSQQRQRIPWQREPVEQEGRPLIQWHREYVQDNFRVFQTIWTEPETHRIVRKERRDINPLTGKPVSVQVCDQYTYDVEPPNGTFDMPSDKPIETPDHKDIMPEVWDTLSAKEQQAIQEMVHRCDVAWRNADFAAFASLWEFKYVEYVPGETEWKERLEQQTGLWSRWHSEVESANTQPFIPIQIATSTFSWGPKKRQVLRVKVKLRVAWSEEGGWEGSAEFYLRRKSRNYRIVHWEFPWEEIKVARTTGAMAS